MSDLSNTRPVYIGLAKSSKVRRCINVAVCSATTLAVKAVHCPQSDFTTSRAGVTRVAGSTKNAGQPNAAGFYATKKLGGIRCVIF
jgi:hypothetical protein